MSLLLRLGHWREVLRPAWKFIFTVPLSVFGAAAFARDEFLSPEQAARLKMPVWLPPWPWHTWLILFLGALLLLVLEGSYRVSRKLSVSGQITAYGVQPIHIADMPIREVYFHIDEDATNNWNNIGIKLLDKLSMGAISAWGRAANVSTGRPLEPIATDYWKDATFTNYFFYSEEEVHVETRPGVPYPAYRDVRFNRSQILFYWPTTNKIPAPIPNIDAIEAFLLVLRRTKWARAWARDWEKLPQDTFAYESSMKNDAARAEGRMTRRLNIEFHDHLRSGELSAWGKAGSLAPTTLIPNNEWDGIRLILDRAALEGTAPVSVAQRFKGASGFAYTHVRLCKEQLLRLYPLHSPNG